MTRMTRRNFGLVAGLATAAALTAGAVISATASAQDAATGAVVGEPAPDFTATDLAGVTHTLSDFADQTVVLEWTNPGCPYVLKHYDSGNIQAMQADAAEDGVIWLTVNSTNADHRDYLAAEAHAAWLDEQGATPTAAFLDESGDIGRLFGAGRTPDVFVIDQGVVAYIGAVDDVRSTDPADVEGATNYVRAALSAIAAGEAVDPAETERYGCTVKYS